MHGIPTHHPPSPIPVAQTTHGTANTPAAPPNNVELNREGEKTKRKTEKKTF
ncbi:predicted protein [Plenodomus lingam JN3]|uniref:Predicted protein n=1 Tax=Leptosphaeria maculans (strain JN3 / isolate v23.1.3 / race Av1-4-5-6-7-8) TaxID=985895 RepID=E4ZX43_LEPMJ|nr:predicted protein [Plenodomus lingam JN3]CBX95253.1 predicted protein [Plenodomus lingam JN3]